jgi:hypothetical protein
MGGVGVLSVPRSSDAWCRFGELNEEVSYDGTLPYAPGHSGFEGDSFPNTEYF